MRSVQVTCARHHWVRVHSVQSAQCSGDVCLTCAGVPRRNIYHINKYSPIVVLMIMTPHTHHISPVPQPGFYFPASDRQPSLKVCLEPCVTRCTAKCTQHHLSQSRLSGPLISFLKEKKESCQPGEMITPPNAFQSKALRVKTLTE